MRPRDIDRALREERIIEPSSDFSSRVMASVRQASAEGRALPFPWRRLAGGLAAAAAAAIAVLIAERLGLEAPVAAAEVAVEAARRLAPAGAWLSATLATTYALISWSLHLADRT